MPAPPEQPPVVDEGEQAPESELLPASVLEHRNLSVLERCIALRIVYGRAMLDSFVTLCAFDSDRTCHLPYVNMYVNLNVSANVNGKRRAARNGRNEKQENEKQITVTAAPFSGISLQLQLQSCFRCEVIQYCSYRRVLSGI